MHDYTCIHERLFTHLNVFAITHSSMYNERSRVYDCITNVNSVR